MEQVDDEESERYYVIGSIFVALLSSFALGLAGCLWRNPVRGEPVMEGPHLRRSRGKLIANSALEADRRWQQTYVFVRLAVTDSSLWTETREITFTYRSHRCESRWCHGDVIYLSIFRSARQEPAHWIKDKIAFNLCTSFELARWLWSNGIE